MSIQQLHNIWCLFGHLLDFSGDQNRASLQLIKRYNEIKSRSDAEAIAGDWRNVGNSLRKVMVGFNE